MTLPEIQESVAGSFADKLNPSVATSSGLDLSFYNVGAPFYFSVTQEGVTSVSFRGNNEEDIAGKIHVTMDADGHPAVSNLRGYGLHSYSIIPTIIRPSNRAPP